MDRRALVVPLDVTDLSQINEAFQAVSDDFGRLDILVNNADIGANHLALEVSEADWDDMMSVNRKGLFFCCQAAAKLMLTRSFGRIINISSRASLVGIRDQAVYCAAKGGVNQLMRVLALEWSEQGATINAVVPTFINTPGTAERLDHPEYLQGIPERLPVRRVGDINDVAAAVIYLASAAGGLITGSTLLVDGGWTAL
jgi:NAD(P)-dependent dehydrogenase (short-subunit alcohol dehydrogenase family)